MIDLRRDDSMWEFAFKMRTQGYYLVENAIPDAALRQKLRGEIDRTLDEDQEASRTGRYRAYSNPNVARGLATRADGFVQLLDESPVQKYIDYLIGDTCIIFNCTGVRLMPGVKNVVANVHRDSNRFSPGYMLLAQVLYFIDDFTLENGATHLLPGSHNAPDTPTDELFFQNSVRITGKSGSALIFDSGLLHAGGSNSTDAPRRGIALVYSRSFMKQMLDIPRMTPPDLEARLSPKVRRLFGYDTRVPCRLEDFYVPVEERLYKHNQG